MLGPLTGVGDKGGGRWEDKLEEVGTCWNARVTSWRDIFEATAALVGGGVSPSSDLTS